MTIGKLWTFLIGFFYAYGIWCFFYNKLISKKYKIYCETNEENPQTLIEFVHNQFGIVDSYYLLSKLKSFKFLKKDGMYKRYIGIRAVCSWAIATALLIVFLWVWNTDYRAWLDIGL